MLVSSESATVFSVQSVVPGRVIATVGHDGEDNDALAVDEIQHPMRKLAQQGSSGSGGGINDNLCGGLFLYPRKRVAYGKKEPFRCQNASLAIPCGGLGNIDPSFGSKGDLSGHNPSCLRISASATAHDTPASGFCR